MNVIHLVRATTWGGGERYAIDLCRALHDEGHNVTVATKGSAVVDGKFRETGARLVKMPLGGVFDVISPIRLARMVESTPGGDEVVVHVHTFKDAEIAARARLLLKKGKRMRIVCTRHLVKEGKRSRRWNWIFRNIDCLVFVSRLAREVFMEGGPEVDEGRICVVHNGIVAPEGDDPLQTTGAGNKDESAGENEEEIILLFTGRISPEKGLERLIWALHDLRTTNLRDEATPELKVRIAGTGKEKYVKYLKWLTREAGVADQIEWLGFVPDVFGEIRKADICVAPSEWREPFGLTIIEYMSQGKPVITTDNGAQKEIITDGEDGILIPPGDSYALAAQIRNLARRPTFRKKLGENARHTFSERFRFDVFYDKIIQVYTGKSGSL